MRVTTGVPAIDNAIMQLRKIDALSGQLFRERISVESYRKQVVELILSMDETGVKMFSATYVDENALPPHLDDGDIGDKPFN